jgi:hypothetical protein
MIRRAASLLLPRRTNYFRLALLVPQVPECRRGGREREGHASNPLARWAVVESKVCFFGRPGVVVLMIIGREKFAEKNADVRSDFCSRGAKQVEDSGRGKGRTVHHC